MNRPLTPALVCALLAGMLAAAPCLALERAETGRSVMVVSAHPAATAAGVEILAAGGNAVDAAVAVSLALSVCEPYSSGLGGGGFFVHFDAATGAVTSLDARETAPAAAHRDMYLVDGQPDADLSRYGPASVAVPALVPGLAVLHASAGRLAWPDLVAPARRLAADGFPVSAMLRDRIESAAGRFDAAARAVFLPGGALPAVGDTLRQPDLARTLEAIARDGAQAVTAGPVAEAVARAAGFTSSELAACRPRWREPIHGRYRGLDVWSMPPPSSGGVHLVQMLNILEGFDLAGLGYGSAAADHLLAETMKHAYADRARWLGDPDFTPVPVRRLTARSYADSLRVLIRPDTLLAAAGTDALPCESEDTTHFSIVDADGAAVAATQTINLSFGSGVMAPGTGIILNDEMDDFAAAPGAPNAFGLVGGEANAVAPGKRPLSSMTPTIVLQEGRVRLVTGSPGGSRIITTALQTIVHVVDFGMDPLRAVSAPRIHHQWLPAALFHEPGGISPDTAALLRARGHALRERDAIGNAQLIVVDPRTGLRHGASDPRGMGAAAGY